MAIIERGDENEIVFSMDNLIPDYIYNDLKEKAKTEFENSIANNTFSPTEILGRMVVDNCTRAIFYINNFISVLKQSKVIINEQIVLDEDSMCYDY